MASATSDRALVLRNVTVVDIERKRLAPRRDVVSVGERVVGIQAGGTTRAPKHGRVLDCSGRFLIPGLWEFHVRVFSAPGEEDFALPLYILNGITGVRDAGALRTLPEQQRVKSYSLLGEPTYLAIADEAPGASA
jgi:predicted amidohydrolase